MTVSVSENFILVLAAVKTFVIDIAVRLATDKARGLPGKSCQFLPEEEGRRSRRSDDTSPCQFGEGG